MGLPANLKKGQKRGWSPKVKFTRALWDKWLAEHNQRQEIKQTAPLDESVKYR